MEIIFRNFPLLRVYYKGILTRIFQFSSSNQGIKVMEEKWDSLIVLDACRFDFFKEINWIPGKLKKRTSLGSHTEEWMRKNFQENYPETIYISGNPQISEVKCRERFGKVPFFEIENVWDYGWDKEKNFLPPEIVTQAAIKMKEKYPEKRLITHYMQPHWPFPVDSELPPSQLRKKSRKPVEKCILWKITEILSKRYPSLQQALKKRKKESGNVWDFMREGSVPPSKAKEAYRQNIRKVLKGVEELVGNIKGKKVITSDHGNLFGEHWMYGHPPRIHLKELVEVPWLEVEKSFDKSEENISEEGRIASKVKRLKEGGMI